MADHQKANEKQESHQEIGKHKDYATKEERSSNPPLELEDEEQGSDSEENRE